MGKDILREIVEKRRLRLDRQKAMLPLHSVKSRIKEIAQPKKDFGKAISGKESIALIAELKKASPSAGVLREDFDPVAIAKEYEKGGVSALSVLTEEDFFQGSMDILSEVRKVSSKPILAKDFLIDEYQIYDAKVHGADCILLIAKLLEKDDLVQFMEIAGELGLCSLVEVHDENDMEKAISSGARIIGINNRNLESFEVDLKTTECLYKLVPGDRIVVSESGINDRNDVEYLSSIGVDAILIGGAIMRAENISVKIKELCLE